MYSHKQKKKNSFLPAIFLLTLALASHDVFSGVGESAVITLAFPPGARATGTAEAFTGVSDDAAATYYNPAGLGQSPLANSWKVYLNDNKQHFTAIASALKKEFGKNDNIWVGTNKGLIRYNGKFWEHSNYYLIEQDDNLESITKKFITIEEPAALERATWIIRKENGIGMKRYASLHALLMQEFTRSATAAADSLATITARQLIDLPASVRSTTKIYALIAPLTDTARADTLASHLAAVFSGVDKEFKDLTELKIPFSIAVKDSVTALVLDQTDKLWVGTSHGIWRLNGTEWNTYTMLEGLPSNTITALATGPYGEIVAGTDKGIAIFSDGQWSTIDEAAGLPANEITAVTCDQSKIIYAGTRKGLAKIVNRAVTVYDTTSGLLSNEVTTLFLDSENRLWIGGTNGVTIFNSVSWKRFQFPNSIITSFAELNEKTIWIGTDKGAISYTSGKVTYDADGNKLEQPPEWKTYHSKNALVGNAVSAITVYNKDVWLTTDLAINQLDNADKQAYVAFELLLPSFGLTELWHLYGALVWPTEWGTIGGSINYINMGNNTIYNALGEEERNVRSWEGVFGLSYGLPITETFSLGLNTKVVWSALAPGGDGGEGVGSTFAIDAAVLKRNLLIKKFDVGFMFQNMGPNVFYVSQENEDPIPFTLRLGLAYRAIETPLYDLTLLLDMSKEVVKNHYNGKPDPFYKALYTDLINDPDEDLSYEINEINYNLGAEFWYTKFLALRTGFLFDYLGERYEWTMGVGIRFGTLNFDFSTIYSPPAFFKGVIQQMDPNKEGATGARDGQWRAAFTTIF